MPPKNKSSNHAKHAFMYLTSFATLGLVAFNVGAILFQIINYYFPIEYYEWNNNFSQDMIKFAIATLVIAGPVYYFFTRMINRQISKKDLDQDSGIRKWLTYIVLFIALGVVIGDLITVIYSFLDGELSVRFILKVLTIFVIAGGVFAYYFTDIRNESQSQRNSKNNVWGIAFWALLLIPLVWAVILMENPQEARMRKIDDETVSQLQSVRYAIEDFYRQEDQLPDQIEEITTPQYYLPDMADLESKNFSYSTLSTTSYELCADFERDNQSDSDNLYRYDMNWEHPAGNHCFELQAPQI